VLKPLRPKHGHLLIAVAFLLLANGCGGGAVAPSTVTNSVASTAAAVPWTPADATLAYQPSTIKTENAKQGTSDWILTKHAAGAISGYASATSVNRGDTIKLFANAPAGATYSIDVFRMGWYGGLGARRMTPTIYRTATVQSVPAPDPSTGVVDCNWTDPYILQIPYNSVDSSDWASGVYLAKLSLADGRGSYIIFIVRDDRRRSDLLFQSSTLTYQAYNNWGGPNFYTAADGSRAVLVSFNRPYMRGDGSGDFFYWEFNAIRFLEREGYDVAYVDDLATHEFPGRLLDSPALLVGGHSEYWTWQMRDAVEFARDHQVNLVFLGANVSYWQVRLQPSPVTAVADRIVVGYKYTAATADPVMLDADPNNDYLMTGNFLAQPVNRPEAAMVGVAFFSSGVDTDLVIDDASSPIFANSGLTTGSVVRGLVGYEVDRITADSPRNILRLGYSPIPLSNTVSGDPHACMTMYSASSGAEVFAAGTMQLSWALDDFPGDPPEFNHDARSNPAVQQLVRNLLNRSIQH
jgi:hypothetical protein